ncbi:MAG: hypothetical protein V1647_02910 [Pseudomonadota bacterium]
MHKLLSFMCGLVLGCINWFVLYKLYRHSFAERKKRLLIAFFTALKAITLFGLLYIVIVVIRFNVLYVVVGLIVSLIIMNVVAFRFRDRGDS